MPSKKSAEELRLIAADLLRLCYCFHIWRWNLDHQPGERLEYPDSTETEHGPCSGWTPTR